MPDANDEPGAPPPAAEPARTPGPSPAPKPSGPPPSLPVAHLEFKAALLMVFLLLMVSGAVLYLSYARGAFERTQQLVLVADDSEGVVVGMDLTFAGFPIGRVRRIELAGDGNARIIVDVPVKDAHWLRESSVFTLVRGVVGNTNIRAYSGVLTDPPLADGAVRTVLRGDTTAEIPRLMASARELLQNLNNMTGANSSINSSLKNVQALTDRLKGPGGGLGVLLGGDKESQKLLTALDRTNSILTRVDALAAKADAMAAKADKQVFGDGGVLPESRETVMQLNGLLKEARASLQKVDAVLDEAKAIGANARVATTDLAALRADVEASLRKVDALIAEVNRKWPFARDTELKLP